MTPLHLKILLHYYTQPVPYSEHDLRHQQSSAVVQFHAEMVRDDLLVQLSQPGQRGASFEIADRGRALVAALCATPLPQHAWVVRYIRGPVPQGATP